MLKDESRADASSTKPAIEPPALEGNDMEATLSRKAVRTTRFGDVVRWMLFPAAMMLRGKNVARVPGVTDMRMAGFLDFFFGVPNKAGARVAFWRRWPLALAVLSVVQNAWDTGKACASMSVSILGGSVFGYLFAVPAALMGGIVGAGVAVAAMVASLAWLVSVGLLAFAGYALVMAAVTGASVTAGGGFAVVLVGALLCWGVAQVGVVVATGVFLRVGGESSLFGVDLKVFE
ncbi:TPA: hypothetical protein VDW01_005885 [Pseudomonas aeruginosa]|uniref:hypothetical protein n=1 Tax=Pseudomonas aeruginosa TaxID=287 RepID=UPI00106A0101|nr:hypothetical protein [Pseudomonas aeruginosa]EJH4818764.1 hypothetical protein [Pseudomonas aeruginosa]EKS3059488.1 hypothetical protein [Pseudomonas aeruginosa]EKU5976172.1 hypothetical protein [Pseudomonas aeruginosa]ELL1256044.1 hypothetical protein [Pseudomonas aeruginosa]ELM1688226.1 hypothetical protein [Pseudomonas aeruginosa]